MSFNKHQREKQSHRWRTSQSDAISTCVEFCERRLTNLKEKWRRHPLIGKVWFDIWVHRRFETAPLSTNQHFNWVSLSNSSKESQTRSTRSQTPWFQRKLNEKVLQWMWLWEYRARLKLEQQQTFRIGWCWIWRHLSLGEGEVCEFALVGMKLHGSKFTSLVADKSHAEDKGFHSATVVESLRIKRPGGSCTCRNKIHWVAFVTGSWSSSTDESTTVLVNG